MTPSCAVHTSTPTDVMRALGAAAATYLGETLANGISSGSATLLATVDAMRPKNGLAVEVVTQLSGG